MPKGHCVLITVGVQRLLQSTLRQAQACRDPHDFRSWLVSESKKLLIIIHEFLGPVGMSTFTKQLVRFFVQKKCLLL